MYGDQYRPIKVQIQHELIDTAVFQLTPKDNIHEIRSHISENTPLCLYENYYFQSQGKKVSEYTEIGQQFNGDVRLSIVLKEFQPCDSWHHYHKVIDMVSHPKKWAALLKKQEIQLILEEEKMFSPSEELDRMFQKTFSSKFMKVNNEKEGVDEFSNMLIPSGFNPVPYYRILAGDFFYIYIKTLQEHEFHITANSEGFFVNNSTTAHFHPTPNNKYHYFVSLIDLLYAISPEFKRRFTNKLQQIKSTQFDKASVNHSYLKIHPWLGHHHHSRKNNPCRTEPKFVQYTKLLFPTKDWNELFNFNKFSITDTIVDKITKEKLRGKLKLQFINSAKQGVEAIFEGKIQPINCSKNREDLVYYHQSLLYYFAHENQQNFSRKKVYDCLVTTIREAQVEMENLSLIEKNQGENILLSHMVIIYHQGYKIIVRNFPSGLIKDTKSVEYLLRFNIKAQFQKHNCIQTNLIFQQELIRLCKFLGLATENIILESKSQIKPIICHPEIKGFLNKAESYYIYDTACLSARDFNFLGPENQLIFYRHQLIQNYNFKQKCNIPLNTVIQTCHKISPTERTKFQESKLKSIAKFAKQTVLTTVLESFQEDDITFLCDSTTVMKILHKNGLSSKYLGLLLQKAEERHLIHLKIIFQRVILVKSLKSVISIAMKNTKFYKLKQLLSHLLNIIFNWSIKVEKKQTKQSVISKQEIIETQQTTISKKKKKKNQKEKEKEDYCPKNSIMQRNENFQYLTIEAFEFWKLIRKVGKFKYSHNFEEDYTKWNFFDLQFSKSAILRDICLGLGIQVQIKQYWSSEKPYLFRQENIVNILTIARSIDLQSSELTNLIEEGDRLVSKYMIEECFEPYNRAVQYIFMAYGGVHEKLAVINKKIANIYFKIGDLHSAIICAHHSCDMYETLLGEDAIETLENYSMLGLYYFSIKKFDQAEYYLKKVIFISTFSFSQCYPNVMITYLNLSTIYETQKKFTDAIMCIFYSLDISIRIYGENHVNTAINYSALAALHHEIPDIQQAIDFQEKCVNILSNLLLTDDVRLSEAKTSLENYRHLQSSKKIKDIHEKELKNSINFPMSSSRFSSKMPFNQFNDKWQFLWRQKDKKMKYYI